MFDIYELNDAAVQHNCNALHTLTTRLEVKVDFGVAKSQLLSHFGLKSRFLRPKFDKKTLWLPNFKTRTCKLDLLALHKSNFSAYITEFQI